MLFKKLTSDEFNQKTQSIIISASLILSILILAIMSFFGLRYCLSYLICYVVSIMIFVKNNIIITYFLTARLYHPRFWMTFNNFFNMAIYMLTALLLVKISYLSLVGLIGLFVIAGSTIIISIIYKE